MEEPLLLSASSPNNKDNTKSSAIGISTWRVIFDEMKRLGYIAGPMVAATVSQYILQIISMVLVGHLGELALSSTAIAISLAGVTGFSFLLGLASALETLSGQAFGGKQYRKVGIQTQTAIFCLLLVCVPLSLIWIKMEKILLFIGQDPEISHEAGKFILWLVPGLFGYAALQPLIRYLQTQSLIFPILLSSCGCLVIHIPLCWTLVYRTELQNVGAAVAIGITFWLNVIFLGLYIKYSPTCAKTRVPLSMELFHGIREFFGLAIPSAVMVCLEWWSYELLILLSGILPNPQLETSVLSVCLNTISSLYAIPYGLGAAASTRISNELGAENPRAAQIAVYAVMLLAIAETTIISSTLFASRNVFGYVFSDEKEVVDYVTRMSPLVCISVILDSLQGTLSGVSRGCGWQHIGAYVNLAAFYLCGIPAAAILCFWVELRGVGLWIGIQAGAFTQTILLSIITISINWEKQARKAKERLSQGVAPIVI